MDKLTQAERAAVASLIQTEIESQFSIDNPASQLKVAASSLAIEINLANKEDGLMDMARQVAEKQGLSPEDVLRRSLVIGDSDNDVAMLNRVARAGGVAVWVGASFPENLDRRVHDVPYDGPVVMRELLRMHTDWGKENRLNVVWTQLRALFNNLLHRDNTELPLHLEDMDQIHSNFTELPPDEQFQFTRKAAAISLKDPADQESSPTPVSSVFEKPSISFWGPVVVDLSLIYQAKRQGLQLVDFQGAGGGDFFVAEALTRFGIQTGFLGLSNDTEARIVEQKIRERGLGNAYITRGPSRTAIGNYVQLRSGRTKEVSLKRQVKVTTDDLQTLFNLADELPIVPAGSKYVLFNAWMAAPGARPENIAQLMNIIQGKGYRILLDFRPHVSPEVMAASFGASPWFTKPNLGEMAKYSGQRLDDLKGNLDEVAELAQNTAIENNISIFVVSMAEDGVLAVYQDSIGQYKTVHIPSPEVAHPYTLGAGNSFIGGTLGRWIENGEKNVPDALLYGMGTAFGSVKIPGTGNCWPRSY